MADEPDFPPGGGPFRRRKPQPIEIKLPDLKGRGLGWIVGAVVVLLIGTLVFVTGRGGLVEVADDEVAVIVNYLSGETELVETPGYKIFLPFVKQAFTFDKKPNKFLMEGDRNIDANHVRKLTVRANDGSNFWFDTLEIQYQLMVSKTPLVLYDSGPGDAFKQNWVRAYARAILRDEFGRYSAVEAANQSIYEGATQRAQDRLNELLNPHGIDIVQIVTPRPQFEDRYEQAINDRKVANQTVEKLKTRAEQLIQERERRLADIERDKATDYEQLLGTLEAERIGAEKALVRVQKQADARKIAMTAEGDAAKQRMLEEARALEEQARKEAEGLRARVEALAARGDVLVRETLAAKLATITFNIVPYRRDPAPVRIEHLGGGVVPATGTQRTPSNPSTATTASTGGGQ